MFSPILARQRVAIATYASHELAAQALDHLVLTGFPLAQVFLIGQSVNQLAAQPAATQPLPHLLAALQAAQPD